MSTPTKKRDTGKPASAFPPGLGPRKAMRGLGHRAGVATLHATEEPGSGTSTPEDLLIPQGVDNWTSSWIARYRLPLA